MAEVDNNNLLDYEGLTTYDEQIKDYIDDKIASAGNIPSGGTTGQVLKKKSNTDYDVEWGEGGSTGDMLKSVYDTNDNGKVDNAEAVEGHTVASSGDAGNSDLVLGNDSRLTNARNAADVYDWAKASTKPSYTAIEVGAIPSTDKGANSGVAELDATGKVPSAQLPSYVDDVLEYSSLSAFPSTGETGKIYIATDTGKTYRWSGTTYVEISESLALGETSSTAYAGNKGKANADAISAIKDGLTIDSFGDVESALTDKVSKSNTVGLLKNDGTVDQTQYVSDISGKADKVSNATNNNFAALDANGNLKDSGHKHSDYLTSHQDISGKADKVSNATSGDIATLDGNGNLTDSGMKTTDIHSIPSGGTTGQMLKKKSGINYDVEWQDENVSTYYGISNTASSTAQKDVIISETFAYTKGQFISVLFTTENSANAPTLNVNGLGAKSIYNNNAVLSSTNVLKWSANKLITFIYDGTYFRVVSIEPSLDGGSWWGTSSTSAITAAKTVTCANFRLIQGAEISVKFSNANTKTDAAITLNVNSTGSKTIYVSGAATSSTNQLTWEANEILTFVYDGSYWVCLTETMGVSALGLSVIDGKIAQTITTS